MALDLLSLLAVTAANLFVLAAALPFLMKGGVSAAARSAQASVVLQATAWACMIGATVALDAGHPVLDRSLSTLAVGCQAASQWQLYRALTGWLGPRPGRRLVPLLALAVPLGYGLGFTDYAFRVGWANFLLAGLSLSVAASLVRPARPSAGHWRTLLGVCLVVMAGFTAARGWLGAFTDLYPSFRTPHPVNLAAALVGNVCLVLGVVALLAAWREEAEQQLRTQALTDSLTGLLNRRGLEQSGAVLLAQARRHGWPLTVAVLDLDHFKPINDRLGHEAGDRALQLFARLLRQHARAGDITARLGGDEFAVLLAHEQVAGAQALVHRLHGALDVHAPRELHFALHFSAGTAAAQHPHDTLAAVLSRADASLYAAKAARLSAAPRAGNPQAARSPA